MNMGPFILWTQSACNLLFLFLNYRHFLQLCNNEILSFYNLSVSLKNLLKALLREGYFLIKIAVNGLHDTNDKFSV